ncbi:MAG: hypothetical protein U1F27_04375 [Turneriella sp.]
MPAFFTSAHIRLSLLLAILGALIALIFTIFSDSGITALIFRPLVSGLLMFVLGSIIYALFAKKVPEVIDVIENRQEDMHEGLTEGGLGGEGDTGFSDDGEGISAEDGPAEASSTYDADYGPSAHSKVSDIPRKTGVQIGKEEITVNGVKFKNQPEVMAETIKQLMEQDKD